jgi:hypothetical protein
MNNNNSSSHHTRVLDAIDINAESALPSVVIKTKIFLFLILIFFFVIDIFFET